MRRSFCPRVARIRYPSLLAVIAALAASAAAAQDTASSSAPIHRPRVGLALAGGGARGGAHVGVLKVLEEMRIPIDCIAGTSMGALVGGGYASGMSASEIDKFVRVSTGRWSLAVSAIARWKTPNRSASTPPRDPSNWA